MSKYPNNFFNGLWIINNLDIPSSEVSGGKSIEITLGSQGGGENYIVIVLSVKSHYKENTL